MNEFDNGNLLDYRNESERHTVNQRFNEMNKQITELTNLVLASTEKISSNDKISSSNREGNDLNTVSIGHETRSDTEILTTSGRVCPRMFSPKGNCPSIPCILGITSSLITENIALLICVWMTSMSQFIS